MLSTPVGEYDMRLVLLTRERGKITAFARGAKRPGNMLMGPSRPFAFGTFQLYEGKDAYNLQSAEISNYFAEIFLDMEQSCYGQYFLEFSDYYSRENLDGSQQLLLIYQSLRALLKPQISNVLIRYIFELRAMVISGEYTEHPPKAVSDSANYTWEFVIASPIESLYTFTVTDSVLSEFKKCVEINTAHYVDREFHSLEILKTLK
ncbi:MAG: DNA repair protein RecO [Hungatella sp.]